MKKVLVLGGGGFIGGHLVKRLVSNGDWVRSVDLKPHQYGASPDEFILGDLSDFSFCESIIYKDSSTEFDEVYQLAADMGGAGYIFSGDNDAAVMSNSASININVLKSLNLKNSISGINRTKVFYSSSACIYPEEKQLEIQNLGLKEIDAYPANPDSEYGWEKLFSERLYLSFARNFKIPVRIARFHNIYGPEGTWEGGREKAPAAICRKVALAGKDGAIQVWGDGLQTRSFLFIEDCLDAVESLMGSEFNQPINIGSEEMVSINEMVRIISSFEEKKLLIEHIDGPQGVRGRNSNNELMEKTLNHKYRYSLTEGLRETYFWILRQLSKSK
jgi:nucleoside-diphosphate-sugar epimerase